mgnify:CR=1 FL=1
MTTSPNMMPTRDVVLVLLVVLAWGSNFTVMKLVLDELPPLLFVGLRFAILVPLIVLFPRPASWTAIIAIGLLINAGHFGFQLVIEATYDTPIGVVAHGATRALERESSRRSRSAVP